MGKPSFIIVGAQRSGTTSLYEYICAHPRIHRASQKELRFYDRRYRDRGLTWYESCFPDGITGEATPSYLFMPWAAKWIVDDWPRIKIIIILRNPVQRAWSHYRMMIKLGLEDLSFWDALRLETERAISYGLYSREHANYAYIERGKYAQQVRRYQMIVPRHRLLILQAEPFFANPRGTMETVFEFLGVENHELTQYVTKNVQLPQQIPPKAAARLRRIYTAFNEGLYALIGQRYNWNQDGELLTGPVVG